MNRIFNMTLIVMLLLAQGCAKRPNNITAAEVSPLAYSAHECDALALEMDRVQTKLSPLVKKQTNSANADAALMTVGLVVFWPALLVMPFINNNETDIAHLKGEYEAVEKAMIQKDCLNRPAVVASAADNNLETAENQESKKLTTLKSTETPPANEAIQGQTI